MYRKLIYILFILTLSCEDRETDEQVYYFFQPNAYYMVADGESTLTLSVMKKTIVMNRFHNISNVEGEVAYFHNGQPLTGNTFTTTQAGEHTFHATYKNWKSEAVTITARSPKDYELISIPLIFHVLYNNEPVGQGANISSSDIENIVSIINQRFRNTYYTLNYPEVVQSPNHVDTKIEFRLAQYDPNGNLLDEPGIKRYAGYKANEWKDIGPQTLFLSENMWSPHDYINISVANQNLLNGATSAKSNYEHQLCGTERTDETWEEYFERNSQGGENTVVFAGIVMTMNGLFSHKTLAHELGHYIGLLHVFDNECYINRWPFGLNDCIEDTQFYNELEYVNPQKSLSKIFYECNTNYLVVHDNYMDYYRSAEPETFGTYYGFTYDQRDRMREVLQHSPWIKDLKHSTK